MTHFIKVYRPIRTQPALTLLWKELKEARAWFCTFATPRRIKKDTQKMSLCTSLFVFQLKVMLAILDCFKSRLINILTTLKHESYRWVLNNRIWDTNRLEGSKCSKKKIGFWGVHYLGIISSLVTWLTFCPL